MPKNLLVEDVKPRNLLAEDIKPKNLLTQDIKPKMVSILGETEVYLMDSTILKGQLMPLGMLTYPKQLDFIKTRP